MIGAVRVVLLLPTTTYRAADFLAAARALGIEVVVASDQLSSHGRSGGVRAVEVPFDDPERAAELLTHLDDRGPIDGIVAVDDQGVMIAAHAAQKLGLAHNPPDAAARTRDKRGAARRPRGGRGPAAALRRDHRSRPTCPTSGSRAW